MNKMYTIILIFACSNVYAQDSLRYFNISRNDATKTGMEVLGSWAIANISTGAIGLANSRGGANKYFYQMDLIWGGANLGAAILGFTNVQRNKNKQLTAVESMIAQQKIEKTFLINGGLDIIYIGAGVYLKHRGDIHNFAELRGYGSSIIIQGVFLLIFDGTMYITHKSNGSKLRQFLIKNPITFSGKALGMTYSY